METADSVLERPATAAKPKSTRTATAKAAAEAVKPQNASLVLVEATLAEYDRVEAGLVDLETKYKNTVYAVATDEGMADAKAARIAIREPRYAVDKAAKAAKAPLNELKKDIDTRAAAITARLVDLETPIHGQIKAEEDRVAAAKEAEKAAKVAAAARAQTAIDGIRGIAVKAVTCTAAEIYQMRIGLDAMETTVDDFGDRAGEAMQAKMQVLETLDTLHAATVAREEADARAAADRAELDAMRAAQAERERKANEEREAQAKADQDKRDEETRAAQKKLDDDRAAFEKEQREARAKRDAEEKRLDDERAKLDADRKKAQDAKDAEEREEQERVAAQKGETRRMRLQEIDGIRMQLTIAQVGRAPYYKGDNVEDCRKVLAETQAWVIAEENFGELTDFAQEAKDSTVDALEKLLKQYIERDRQVAEQRDAVERDMAELRCKNASGAMLEALQAILSDECFVDLHPAVQGMANAAVTEATGEPA